MSMSYWMIEGIGFNANKIKPHLNIGKVVGFFSKQFPDEADLRMMIFTGNHSDFDIDDYLYGNGFEDLADVLCHCDDTDTLTFCDDGDGNCYFYYPPSMPWDRMDNDPKSEQEVIDRIIAATQKITDLSAEEITSMIDKDLYVVGMG